MVEKQQPRKRRVATAAGALLKISTFLGFMTLKIGSLWNHAPVYSGDGRIWAQIAELPLLSKDFLLLARRPIALPLLYKLTGDSDASIVHLQICLSTVAWGFLALAIARLAKSAASLLLFVGVLAVALSDSVHSWDIVIRAESTSHSFLMLTVGAAIFYLTEMANRGPRASLWAGVCAFFACWCSNARDTNGYVLFLLAAAVAGASLLIRAKERFSVARWSLAVVLGSLLLFPIQAAAVAKTAQRYDFPLMNVIFQRVLPNEVKRDYFVETLHMPLSGALLGRARKWASSDKRYAFRAAELSDFRQWLITDGYSGYQKYLLTHLRTTFAEAYPQWTQVMRYTNGKAAVEARTALSDAANSVASNSLVVSSPGFSSLIFAAISALTICLLDYRARVLAIVGLVFVTGSLSQLYICYHGDAMEVVRHGIVSGILLKLGMVVAAGLSATLVGGCWTRTGSQGDTVGSNTRTRRGATCTVSPDFSSSSAERSAVSSARAAYSVMSSSR